MVKLVAIILSINYRLPQEQKEEDRTKSVSTNSKSFYAQRFLTPKYFKSKKCGRGHYERTEELQVPLSSSTQDRVVENKGHENHKLCKEIRILFECSLSFKFPLKLLVRIKYKINTQRNKNYTSKEIFKLNLASILD